MGILSENIDRKFIESFNVDDWEVYTECGFKDIISSNKTIEYSVYRIELDNGLYLECADDHILIDKDFNEVFAKDSLNKYIITDQCISKVISVDNINKFENMFDLSVNSQNNTYFTNGILSHNTQTTSAFLLHFCIFNASKDIAVLANKGAQAQEILERIQQSFEFLPKFLQGGIRTYNKRSMKLDNLSRIFCAATSSSSIRGKSIALLYVDETAFIANDVEFFESTYPVISSGKNSRVILTSTPNGQKGYFYKKWVESTSKQNLFISKLVTWNMVPGRDRAWADEQIANTSIEQFNQEHGCQFRGSQNSLLSSETLETLIVHPIIDGNSNLKIYEQAVKDEGKEHLYVMTVDTSRGVGKDYSAFVVYDVSQNPYKVVATFRDNYISPMRYPYIIQSVGIQYNNAYIIVETNDIGGQVADILYHELEYENIFTTRTENRRTVLSFGLGGTAQVGVRTTTLTKNVGISNIKTLIERQHIELCDEHIIDEFGTFIPKGKSYEADKGCNDDMVMCCIMFGWLSSQDFFRDLTDVNTRQMVIDRWKEEMDDEFVPFIIESAEFGTFSASEVADRTNNNDFWESNSDFVF